MTRDRTRRIATLLALPFFAANLLACSEVLSAPIVIDGSFDDWTEAPIVATDGPDPAAVLCDFREVRATSDGRSVFLSVRLQHAMTLKISSGSVTLLIDSDGDPTTGWSENGMDGVEIAIQGHPGDTSAVGKNRVIGLRFSPPGEKPPAGSGHESLNRSGLMSAPAFQSDLVELSVPRGLVVPGLAAPVLSGRRARMQLVATLPGGEKLDEIGPFPIDLERFGGEPEIEQPSDPLERPPGTRLRVLEWNVSHRTVQDREDQIVRVLSVLSPDIVLLNEMDNEFSSERVASVLEKAGIVGASGSAHVVLGRRGGDERAVVAGRFPLAELPDLTALGFPKLSLRKLRYVEQATEIYGEQIRKGIQSAGAVVKVEGRRILLASLGLKSGAYRAFEIEERIRQIQAMTISSAIAKAGATNEHDAIIVAGDFNLVVTRRPLTTLTSLADGVEADPAPLTVVDALQLDGRSNTTWSNAKLPFVPGRLDFMMYSGSALELERAFVFDSRDLSARWLRHHDVDPGISSSASDHFPIVADFSW